MAIFSRSPHGERGLKLNFLFVYHLIYIMSLSSRRAWIEMEIDILLIHEKGVALLTESVD